jgi:hypothetical protein
MPGAEPNAIRATPGRSGVEMASADPVGDLIAAVRDHLLDWRRPGSGYRILTDEVDAHQLASELVDLMWDWEP